MYYFSRSKTKADVSTTGSVNWKIPPGITVNRMKGNCQLKILYSEKVSKKYKIFLDKTRYFVTSRLTLNIYTYTYIYNLQVMKIV